LIQTPAQGVLFCYNIVSMPTIRLHNQDVAYDVRRSHRARYMRLTMHRGGDFVVTVPDGIAPFRIEALLLQKARWILSKTHLLSEPKPVMRRGGRREYLKLRESARRLVMERLAYWKQHYPFQFGTVRIKNHKAVWGSCSVKKNLNFNYRLIQLPLELADYVIVHELCHTLELNHSTRFWNLMQKFLPNYRNLRDQLKKQSLKML